MRLTAVVVVCAALFAACKKDTMSTPQIPAAGLMVFNLAPDQQAVNVALSNNWLPGGPLRYTSYNGFYQNIYTGSRDINVYDAFRDSSISKSTFDFQDSTDYSLFVLGNKGVYSTVVVKDDIDTAGTSDKAFVRYVNAVPDSSSPVVTITAGSTQVSSAPEKFGTVSGFASVTPGQLAITLGNGGNISANRTFSVEAGKVYTALLIGDPAATDSSAKVQIRYIVNGVVSSPNNK